MRVGTPKFIGARLKEAREARGLTCLALANTLGVTRSSVSNYENGLQTPSPEVLSQLSVTLCVHPHFFMRPAPPREPAAQFFRCFHSATKHSRQVASRKYEWFRDITAFVRQFVKFPDVDVPNLCADKNYQGLTDEDVEDRANTLRSHWQLGDRPISNVVWLLENKGIMCARFMFGSASLDAFSEWRGVRPYVVLAADKLCCVRSRFDAAHELAHLVLHRDVDREQLESYSRFSIMERQADRFASAFLLPDTSFVNDFAPSLDSLLSLKRQWHVSIAAMVHRGRQLNLISDSQERNLWRQIGRRKWRTREPLDDQLPAEQPEFLRRSILLLEKRGVSSVRDIAFQFGQFDCEIAQLAGIDERMEMEVWDKDRTKDESPATIPMRSVGGI